MASSAEEFMARARSIFDALGEPTTNGWKLDTQQGFRPGAEDGQDSSDEEEGAEPQPLEGAAGSDDEGIEEANQYRVNASCAYVRAFEQEEEEDEFDRQAAGSGDEGSRPLRSMEVLEDNAFDRMHSQQYSQQHRSITRTQQQQQQASSSEPSPAAAGNSAGADAAPAAMDVDDDDLPHLEPTAAASARTSHTQQGPAKQDAGQEVKPQEQLQQQHPAKRHRTGVGQVWVPPHRRPDFMRADEMAPLPQQSNEQQQQRRVRFADGGPVQQQQQQGRDWTCNTGRRRGRGSFVPDHVKNPHKYTVYTLDEPLYVGQGGGDDGDNERAAAAAGVHDGQVPGRRASSRGRAVDGGAGSMLQQEPAGEWMHVDDDAPILLEAPETVQPSVHTATAAGDGEACQATASAQPPAAGTIKFQPSSKRICGDAAGSQPQSKAAAATALSTNATKHLGAFADDDEPNVAAVAPATVQKSRKSSRQYRTKHEENEDA